MVVLVPQGIMLEVLAPYRMIDLTKLTADIILYILKKGQSINSLFVVAIIIEFHLICTRIHQTYGNHTITVKYLINYVKMRIQYASFDTNHAWSRL